MVPEGWEQEHLAERDIAVIDGDRGKNYPSAGELTEQGHCLFLSAKNVTKNGFAFDETQFVSLAKHQALRKGHVSRGDIVLTTRGTVGNVALYDNKVPYDVMRINSGMVVVRNSDAGVSTDFLDILFRSFVVQNQVQRLTFGSAQPQLTVGIINKFKLPLPPLAEQRKIADILSTWDRAIETTEALLATARTQKRALMQSLLTGKRRFPEFGGDEWKEVRLDQVAAIKKGQQKSKSTLSDVGEFPVINGGIVASGYTDEWNTDAGTITISEGGNSCGFVNLIDRRFWSGGHCYTLEELRVQRNFLFHTLKFKEAKIMSLRVGSGLPNIQKKAVSGVLIALPSQAEQRRIVEVLDAAWEEENGLISDVEKLRTEKKALMQQLLTGKRRVVV